MIPTIAQHPRMTQSEKLTLCAYYSAHPELNRESARFGDASHVQALDRTVQDDAFPRAATLSALSHRIKGTGSIIASRVSCSASNTIYPSSRSEVCWCI
uniref:AlNc14C116G6527 protein n=1 Tax=Albugo laibachii Nc14 TaxID=890382 RepID=F0WIZ1_9STRA|nr:AlNc14C116G6527 [Albugo laibachii Nc14]CCA27712.1 AlNc14C646G12328 [Albugo laibachii Nc14]|eukprot:CCA27712.1 AlNc14C646G12328 [Albugo laibachii Nc14]